MSPKRLLRVLLVLALPAAGLAGAWLAARARQEPRPLPAAPPPAQEPRQVERRALAPEPRAAAPAHGALARPPDAWVERNNQAITDLAAGDLAAAVDGFERCLAAAPTNPVYAGNLAEALVRRAKSEHERGRIADAVGFLARAVELGPTRDDIETLRRILERWRRELELAGDDWTEGSSRFELSFDTAREDILHHSFEVLEHLEESYDDLVRWFGSDPLAGDPPLRVVLYEPEDFDRLTGLGDWAAGLFDGVVRVSVRDLQEGSEWRQVLVHELVHAFVAAQGGARVPGWLNEGLAQLLENRPEELAQLVQRLRGFEPFTLEELGGSLAEWTDPLAIGRAYAQSLVFVDFLRRTYGEESLRRMLLGPAQGQTVAAAFEAWTSVPLALAFQDWRGGLAR